MTPGTVRTFPQPAERTAPGHSLGHSAAIEDYVKAIYALELAATDAVTVSAVAERLQVTPPAASAMVRRLAEKDLVTHEPYRGVELTAEGQRLALEVMRHHRLIELFLARELGMPWDRVHVEADVLEHVISEELEELIARKLGDPERDPHGDPIPSSSLELEEGDTKALSEMEEGEWGVFTRVSDADSEMLRYLDGLGISPGDRLELVARQPFDGPLSVRFEHGEHALGGALADAMRVEVRG